jgi:hypothetical protein
MPVLSVVSLLLHLILILFQAPAKITPANFAGAWRLNPEKSEGVPAYQNESELLLVVEQTAKQLTANQKVRFRGQDQPSQPLTYSLEGKETTAAVSRPAPGTMHLQAAWLDKGRTLELRSRMSLTIHEEEVFVTTKEYWELRENGRELRIERTRETPQGEQVFKLVFELQPAKQ